MVRVKLVGSLALVMVLAASLATAGVPDLNNSSAATAAAGTQVSVYSLPNGSGDPINNCYAFGSVRTDATITVTLLDALMQPVFAYPFEDLWLETTAGGMVFCPGGTVADQSTDASGVTTFSGALFAGGASDQVGGEMMQVMVAGFPLNQPALDILVNSPDINKDLDVTLSDIVFFTQDYFDYNPGLVYNYRSDFNFDGAITLPDIVFLAQGQGAACP